MNALLDQLGLDNSFFIEFGIISVVFLALSQFYFRPFLKLFEARHKRTVEDREAAERLMLQANAKLEEYKKILMDERILAKKGYDLALAEARKEEAQILFEARDEAKKMTQEAAESVSQQREKLQKELEGDIDSISRSISERLLSGKV